MSFEILPHTAEVGVAAAGATAAEAISEAVRGLASILVDGDPPAATGETPIALESGDEPGLLAAVLDEALYILDVRAELAVGARLRVDGAIAAGVLTTAPSTEVRTQVKAVTYHQLALHRDGALWRAVAYFDV